ncbi:transcription factor tfiiic complex a box associated subunit sfc1 [Pleomassaria siparia CBS 279.74]|uniref:Transcription factor tfiiic complex a box associated subunit sfc1 n=1 Tax=Pleomassaria siparia CBS 279.74 TaxID=1314801 RepID=A0A6G1JS38_9PLEO|nr:transcription factor tfiiic complex a box associated subunit sfc1 [Pleomassaria siparia CBS 279.74]
MPSAHPQPNDLPSQADGSELAPWLSIPSRAISVVEHPCIVKNVDKGIASLGGAQKLSKALLAKPMSDPDGEDGEQLPELISASLRPDDPLAKRILATPVTTSNLLLKITVPKRTGRRRRRGSSGPFVAEDGTGAIPSQTNTEYINASHIFRSLQDNASRYSVTPVGVVDESHRFRHLPDIQYAAGRNEIMTNIRDNLLPLRYSQLKKFKINTAPGADLTKDLGPSAEYLQMPVAFNYKFVHMPLHYKPSLTYSFRFQQNAFVKYTGDGRQEVNTQRRMARFGCTVIHSTAEAVPTGPQHHLPPEDTLTPYMQSMITELRDELHHRPIITRHYLYNKIGWAKRDRLREAAVYCGYFFESGPWREALIVWGVDPRKDPSFRVYQTISFISYRPVARRHQVIDGHIQNLARMSVEDLAKEHTFDGIHVSKTGNLFQFCDITDPVLRRILDTEDIRTVCAPTFQGWYHVGTWAKVTVILKDKMNRLIRGETPDNSLYERILAWPELWDDAELYATYRKEVHDFQIHKEKLQEHTVMHTVRWAAKNPRWAFEKLEKMAQQRTDGEDEPEMTEDVEVPEDATEVPDTADVIFNEGEPLAADLEPNFGDNSDEDGDALEEEGPWEDDGFESD